jgi:hypothetical protein
MGYKVPKNEDPIPPANLPAIKRYQCLSATNNDENAL